MVNSLNRVFRVVWSRALGAWVAVSECARVRGVGRSSCGVAVSGTMLAVLCGSAMAGPTGGVKVNGSVSFSNPSAGATVINQTTNQATINWPAFSIGAGESVHFEQPGTTSVVLNRVVGSEPSSILGSLTATGRVFLVNPNGILFGAGSRVDVGGLVASTLSISDADFEADRYRFVWSGKPGELINQGEITATSGGVLALLGKQVKNEGTMTAPGGLVALAAGGQVALDLAPDAARPVTISAAVEDAKIDSSGRISAHDGRVILSARAADTVIRSIINHQGVIEARGMTTAGGRVVLEGGGNGVVSVTGRIDASSAAGVGGSVQVTGNAVAIKKGAVINADGATGGGSVMVGGTYVDANLTTRTTRVVDAEAGASLSANATQSGDGGSVALRSVRFTRFLSAASARGGAVSGNGGLVQVKSLGVTDFGGQADVAAPAGNAGKLSIEMRAAEIHAGNRVGDARTLDQLVSDTAAPGVSRLSVGSIEGVAAGTVSVQADGYVSVRDLAEGGAKGRIDLHKDVSLDLFGRAMSFAPVLPGREAEGGSGLVFANADNTLNATGKGTISLRAGDATGGANPLAGIYNVANLSTEGGKITLLGADKITIMGAVNSRGGAVEIDADADRLGAGLLIVNGRVNSDGGNIRINSGADESSGVHFLGDVNAGAGRLVLDVSPTATPSDPASYKNSYRVAASIAATGDIAFGQKVAVGGNARIAAKGGAVRFGGPVNFDPDAALELTAGQGGVQFAKPVSGNGGSLTIRPDEPNADIRLGASGSGMDVSSVLPQISGFKTTTIGRADGTGVTVVSGNAKVDGTLNLTQGGTGGRVVFAPGTRLEDGGKGDSALNVNSGGDATFGADTKLTFAQGITTVSGGVVSLESGVKLSTTAPASKVVIAANALRTINGAAAFDTPRWLVYLPDPTGAKDANLQADFKRYGCAYGVPCESAVVVPGNGNGFLYRIVPTVSVSSDSTSAMYGDADPSKFKTRYTGWIDGDSETSAGLSGQATHTLAGFTPTPSGHRAVGDYAIDNAPGNVASELGYRFVAGPASTHKVTPKTITAPGLAAQTREYDGTTNATAVAGALGTLTGDRVGINVTGARFDDAHAGTGKTVTAAGALTGPEAGNYRLASSDLTGSGVITPKVIDAPGVRFQSRTYDGTTAAQGAVTSSTPSGVVAGDAVGVVLKQANFSDKNVGQGKAVTGELGLTGASSGDYALRMTRVVGQANITPKLIDVPGVNFNDRVYDGTTNASGALRPFAPGAVVAGDSLRGNLNGARFADPAAGQAKTVTGEAELAGGDAGNYRFTNGLGKAAVQGTATIFPLVYEASKERVYGASRNQNLKPENIGDAATRLVAGGVKLPPDTVNEPVTRLEK